jgi:hypothetical protein
LKQGNNKILVVAPQCYRSGKAFLEPEQKFNHAEAVRSTVDIIAEEDHPIVLLGMNLFNQPSQFRQVSMNITDRNKPTQFLFSPPKIHAGFQQASKQKRLPEHFTLAKFNIQHKDSLFLSLNIH